MIEEHPFANYIRILGKGQRGARSLTQDEAYDAMKQIFCYDVEPEQLGAFLMLMRVKEETAEEVAGFVRAIKESIAVPEGHAEVAIDWSSYAGKRRQMPWYLLAALTLSANGHRVFMHGLFRDDERVYTRQALQALDMVEAKNLNQASSFLKNFGFAYLDINNLSHHTSELIGIRQLLGLRAPLHTVARMLNPFDAPLMMQSVFHPNYAETHQLAAQILGQEKALAFKGEGGEVERIPERAVKLYGLSDGEIWQEEWPGLLPPDKYVPDSFPDWKHYKVVWLGDEEDAYAKEAIVGTIALVLRALGSSKEFGDSYQQAEQLWLSRHDKNMKSAV